MGHAAVSQTYRHLRERLDTMPVGAPGSQLIYEILAIVYTPEEAEIAVQIPNRLCRAEELATRLQTSVDKLRPKLDAMADKGLLFDLQTSRGPLYIVNPTVVGFFEFSMMRVREDIDQKKLARLLHRYIVETPEFLGQFGEGTRTTPFRALAHEPAMPEAYTEVLDWEKASFLVNEASRCTLSICHCRHVQHHRGKDCKATRMEICLSLGVAADYLVRHNLGRPVSREEAHDVLAEAREAGVVYLCDNVQRRPSFICNCCGCCCEVLQSFKRHNPFGGSIFSSNFEAEVDPTTCDGCRKCARACPANAIKIVNTPRAVKGEQVSPLGQVDPNLCLGCGVCVLRCESKALRMKPRARRWITPETTTARLLSIALEQGKLPQFVGELAGGTGVTAQAVQALVGGIMQLPIAKRLILNDAFRSRFVSAALKGARKLGVRGAKL